MRLSHQTKRIEHQKLGAFFYSTPKTPIYLLNKVLRLEIWSQIAIKHMFFKQNSNLRIE